MGGGFALLAANDGFDAASVNYGRLPRDLETRSAGACPLVANYGARTEPCAARRPSWIPR